VLLADEMGLGKTIQAIAALRLLAHRGALGAALVVVPAGLLLQWRRQIRDWAPELAISTVVGGREERLAAWRRDALVFLCSYDVLRIDAVLPAPFGPGRRTWGVVVADEAQRFKNPHTGLAATMRLLQRERAWALTGTPVENTAEDAASILDFVAPGLFDRRLMMVGLRRALAQVQLRRRRAEVLPALPPKTAFTVGIDLGPRQRAAYDAAEAEGLVWLGRLGRKIRVVHVLELILRLKQICNACPETGDSAKLDDLRMRLAAALEGGGKALVFSQFAAWPFGAEMLAAALAGHRPLVLTGAMAPAQRDEVVRGFMHDPDRRVMVLSLRAGGLGLNLTEAATVFHFDRWWNPAVETQAEDRAHRLGQTRPVQVFAYLCAETVESRIAEILEEKRALFADLIDDVAVAGLRRLTLAELMRGVGVGGRTQPPARPPLFRGVE
jgi:SNF2 family DNA or RNA helicase